VLYFSKLRILFITLFSKKFSSDIQEWWYSKKPGSKEPGNISPSEID